MLLKRSIATRYATALFELAKEKNILEAVEKDFPQVAQIVGTNHDLFRFLTHPAISNDEKKAMLSGILEGKIDDTLYDAICLAVDKGREAYIPMMWEEYRKLLMEHRKQAKAVVNTPYELSAELKKELTERLSKALGKSVILEEKVEKELIGGIKVQIGDRVYDGSIVSRLGQLRDAMLSARV